MKCPRCDRAAERGQRFCNGCGLRLTAEDGSTLIRDDDSHDHEQHSQPARTATNRTTERPNRARVTDVTTGATRDESSGSPRPTVPAAPVAGRSNDGLPATPPAQPATEVTQAAPTSTTRQAAARAPSTQQSTQQLGPQTTPEHAATNAQPVVPDVTTPQPRPSVDATSVHYVPPAANPTRVHGTQPNAAPATAVVPMTTQGQPVPRWRRFRFSTTAVLGVVVGVLSVASIFVRILRITTSPAVIVEGELPYAFRLGNWYLGDLGSNLPMALLIIAVLSLSGAAAAGYGWTWGAGLVGGASTSLVGIAAMTIGFAQMPIDGARQFAQIPTETPFNVLITRDVGYWMLVGTAALGIIAAFASLNECFADRQRDLNPWIAAVGALSVVTTVGGVLLPVQQAVFSDNWYVIQGVGEAPPMLVAGRLVQLALLLIAGVVGFLLVRPYGLGLAMGGTLPTVWLGVSVLVQPNRGVGPGWRNPGAASVDLHGLTIIGLATLVSMLVLACLSAYNQYATRVEVAHARQTPGRR